MIILLIITLLTAGFSQLSSCPTNCEFCTSFNTCQECRPTYNLFTNNTCINSSAILGCQLYSLSNNCARCIGSYMLYNGECYPPVSYCTAYASAGRCQRCLSNYLLFEGQCLEQGKTSCPLGLALYNNSCVQIDILNCVEISQGVCKKCSLEYSLINGLCILLRSTNSCLTLSPNKTCLTCQIDQYLFNGVCGSVFLDNCNRKAGFVCQACNGTDYVLSKGSCKKKENITDPFCLWKDLQTNKCARCAPNYQLNLDKICIRINPSCATTDASNNCLSCSFPLTLLNNLCVHSDINCQQPDFQTQTCQKCKPGFQLETNGLTCKSIKPCITQLNNGLGCAECLDSYRLIKNACYLIPKHCVDTGQNGICMQCSTNTRLFGGICVYADPQCLMYERQAGFCIKCSKNYTLSEKGCISLPNNCLSVNNRFECLTCEIGFQLRNKICVKAIPNCLYYQKSKCVQCEWYYYTDKNGNCQSYPSLCNMVDNSGQCISCQQGLTLYFGKCVFYQTFCVQYSNDQGAIGNCVKAQNTFNLSKNFVIGSSTANYWDSKGNIVSCNGVLTLKDQVCVNVIVGCSRYDQLSNCHQCSRGFALILNQCILDTNICLNKTIDGCVQCIGGFVPFNGTCFSYQNNAQQWDIQGRPIKATEGSMVTGIGMAHALPFNCLDFDINSEHCTKCQPQFVILNGRCVIQVKDCLNYNQRGICQICSGTLKMIRGMCRNVSLCETMNDNQCLKCFENTRLMSGVCIPNFKQMNCSQFNTNFSCSKCRNGFYLLNEKCYPKLLNCADVDSTAGLCVNCYSGYRLHNNSCLPNQPNCELYAVSTGLCSVCSTGYTLLVNYSCYEIPPLCQGIDPNTLKCTSCLTNNVLVNNQTRCANIISNCAKFYSDGNCAQCQTNYSLIDGECSFGIVCNSGFRVFNNNCVKKIPNCVKYVGVRCSDCRRGYFVAADSSCYYNPQGCKRYVLSFGCTQCTDGYSLINATCFKSTNVIKSNSSNSSVIVPNCEVLTNSICQKCTNNYLLLQNKCFFVIEKCTTYSSTGVCLACSKGYYLNRQKRCLLLPSNCLQSNPFGVCLICNNNYILVQNVCLMNITDCINFNTTSGFCTKCKQGLALINGSKCSSSLSNCTQTNSNGKCIKCKDDLSLNAGSCFKMILNCNTYNIFNGSCAGCTLSYYLSSNSTCELLPLNCVKADLQGKCTQCSNQSFIYQSLCIKIVSNCKSYNSSTFNCSECMNNYKLIENSCVLIPSNCQLMSYFGACLLCNNGFSINNGNCVENQKPSENIVLIQNTDWPLSTIINSNCPPNYYLVQGCCYKNISFTYPASTLPNSAFVSSSLSKRVQLPCLPRIGSLSPWQPDRNAPGEWVGYSLPTTLRIQAVQIQGDGISSWISKFVLKYKTTPNSSSFECVNYCNIINGTAGSNDIVTISFSSPIVAREMRIYPQEWSGQIACRFEFLSD